MATRSHLAIFPKSTILRLMLPRLPIIALTEYLPILMSASGRMQTGRFGLLPIGSANVATWWLAAGEHPCYRDFSGGGHARLELANFRCRNARHAVCYPQVGCEPHSSSCRHSSFSSRPADLSYSAKGRRNRCRSVGRADLAYDPDSGFDIGTWDGTARQRRLRSIAKRGPPATEWLTRLPITYGGFWAKAERLLSGSALPIANVAM